MATEKNADVCAAIKATFHEPRDRRVNAKQLAEDINVRDEFALYELANPNSTQHVYVEHVIALFKASNRDPRVLDVVCGKCGGVFVDLESYRGAKGEGRLAGAMKAAAVFFKEGAEALEDGRVTPLERAAMEKKARAAIATIVAFTEGVGR